MGSAIALRADFDGASLRGLAKATKDAAQSRRLLALAEICDGGGRSDAARIGGVGLQVIRDWVLRFNADGPKGLIDRKAPGKVAKLNGGQRRALAAIVESGPIPAIHGVVRWRLKDLAHWIFEEFRISLDETTVGRELKSLGFRKVSARRRHYAQNELAIDDFKKLSQLRWRRSAPGSRVAPTSNSGGRTKRGSVRKTRSLGDGRPGEPDQGRRTINVRSRPISSAPSVPSAASARPSSCPAATPRPCNGISTKSRPRRHRALMPSSSLIRPGGTPRTSSRSRPTSRFYPCPQGLPNSIRSRTSGSSCATTGSPTGSSTHTTTSSRLAVMHGTTSSISRGKLCPSDAGNGHMGSD